MVYGDLLRIFWPTDAPREKRQGVVVGWRNEALDIFVVSILQDVEVWSHYGCHVSNLCRQPALTMLSRWEHYFEDASTLFSDSSTSVDNPRCMFLE